MYRVLQFHREHWQRTYDPVIGPNADRGMRGWERQVRCVSLRLEAFFLMVSDLLLDTILCGNCCWLDLRDLHEYSL